MCRHYPEASITAIRVVRGEGGVAYETQLQTFGLHLATLIAGHSFNRDAKSDPELSLQWTPSLMLSNLGPTTRQGG